MQTPSVSLGLIQMAMAASPADNRARAAGFIRDAAAQGAEIIVLPELFTTLYFCHHQELAHFDLAEPIPGPTTAEFSPLAAELGVVLVLPLFERVAPGLYFNTVAVIDADGTFLGKYRKQHIPQDPGFEEKFYFTEGDLGYPVFETRFAKIGVLICWDQWFPEAARLMALGGAELLIYPTAIGWLADEKNALGAAQLHAWQTVQCGHAVANGCYLAAVNRVGVEGQTEFWGHSFVSDFYGQHRVESEADEGIELAQLDLHALEDFRRIWPFFRDRRVDTYEALTQRWRI